METLVYPQYVLQACLATSCSQFPSSNASWLNFPLIWLLFKTKSKLCISLVMSICYKLTSIFIAFSWSTLDLGCTFSLTTYNILTMFNMIIFVCCSRSLFNLDRSLLHIHNCPYLDQQIQSQQEMIDVWVYNHECHETFLQPL